MNGIPTTSTTLLRDVGSSANNARWGEFVERYHGMMVAYLKANFPSLEAEDIVQETLMALSVIMPNYRYDPEAKGYFHNYLTGILRNKARRGESYINFVNLKPPSDKTIYNVAGDMSDVIVGFGGPLSYREARENEFRVP